MLLEFNIHNTLFDFICLTETWLTPETEQLYNIQNYNVFHSSRISRGCGVSIHIRSRYIACMLSEMSVMHQSIETVFVNVSSNSKDLVIECIYRPPKSDCNLFYSKIEDLLYCAARS